MTAYSNENLQIDGRSAVIVAKEDLQILFDEWAGALYGKFMAGDHIDGYHEAERVQALIKGRALKLGLDPDRWEQ